MKPGRFYPLAAFALSAAAYAPLLRADFVGWDDDPNILFNPHLRGLGADNLGWMLTTNHMTTWQPLSWLSLAFDHALGGLHPLPYHLSNILLFAAAAAAVCLALRELLPKSKHSEFAAFFGAAVFALHPLRVEVVGWVSNRSYVLAALLAALSVYFHLQKRPGAALAAFSASILAKPLAAALPLVLLLLGRATRPRDLAPLFAASALGLAASLWAKASTGMLAGLGAYGPLDRLLLASFGALFYPAKTLIPSGLSPFYELPPSPLSANPAFLLSLPAALGITWLLWNRRRKQGWMLKAWGAYLLLLLPVSGLVQFGAQAASDKWSLLPSFVVAWLAAQAYAKRPRKPAALGLLVALMVLSQRQARHWMDAEALWTRAIAVDPGAQLPHINLADFLARQGRWEESAREFALAARIRPLSSEEKRAYAIVLANLD